MSMEYGSMQKKNVLVAGISHSCNCVVKTYLNFMGVETKNIRLSESGNGALAEAQSQLFDIIVVDTMLPEIDGVTLAKKVKEQYHWASPKIIWYYASPVDNMKEVFDASVMKPSTRKEFETALIDVLKNSDTKK